MGLFVILFGWIIRDNVFAYTPVELYDNVWRLINTKYVDQTNNEQDWNKWRHKYDKVIMSNEDYLAASKIIYNFTKDHDFYKIKAGVVDGKVMTADEIITLAKLPSREELLAKFAGALLGNITKLAIAVNQVKEQKENA